MQSNGPMKNDLNRIQWDPSLSVDVVDLDSQHKSIIAYINVLAESINRDSDKLFIQDIFDSLYNHMSDHFSLEEKYFEMYDYSGAKEHGLMHADFLKFLSFAVQSYKSRGVLLEGDVVLIFDWLVNHIKGVDKMYVPCFHQHGLK